MSEKLTTKESESLRPTEVITDRKKNHIPEVAKTKEFSLDDVREEIKNTFENDTTPSNPEHSEDDQEGAEEKPEAQLVSPIQKDKAFEEIMDTTQKELSPGARAFSKVIHNKQVEATSDFVGSTIARPTSILFGSIFAFIFMLGVYLLARYNGFRLSGSEFILLFIAGWFTGLLVDLVRNMILGRRG